MPLDKTKYQDILNQIEEEAIRARMGRNEAETQEQQNLGALEERRLFSKHEVAKNPLMAIPLMFGAPIDAAAKKIGLRGGRSNSGFLPETGAAFQGIGEGLKTYITRNK